MTMHALARLAIAGTLILALPMGTARASDHADPMSINVFAMQESPEANITDLHAFVVDGNHRVVTSGDPLAADNRLVVSVCVRRALKPEDARALDLRGYTFRVHLDLDPRVRFAGTPPPGADLAARQRDESMQALYGGIFTQAADIVDDAILEFELDLDTKGDAPVVVLKPPRISGIWGTPAILPADGSMQPPADTIGVTAAVFDDPFIFPRFFRRNVVGIVTSIPLSHIPGLRTAPGGHVPIVLWATTHKGGTQIDHVGRSLRTQLPRFGYLNDTPPARHVREIQRVHAEPTIMEALLGAVVSPLFAHRHYDSVPDVMVYDLRKPARFPNGRALTDDVARILAAAGETLLLELSYAESRQFVRAERNDKDFDQGFPYLAPRWDPEQIEKPPALRDGAPVPQAPDRAAIAAPDLDPSIWQRLALYEGGAILALAVSLIAAVRARPWRSVLGIVAIFAIWQLHDVHVASLPGAWALFYLEAAAIGLLGLLVAFSLRLGPFRLVLAAVVIGMIWRLHGLHDGSLPPVMAIGAAEKITRLIGGVVLSLAFGVGLVFAIGRRTVRPAPTPPEPSTAGDRQAPMLPDDARHESYADIHAALFDPAVSRPYYEVWGGTGERPLPIYKTTLATLVAGALAPRNRGVFAMLSAARRTLRTRGDLRWGVDRNGFRRLVHPMGVCLAGTWRIDPNGPATGYSGFFARGSEGRVIARYSLGGNQPKGGHARSLGLVGKVFPQEDAADGVTPRAHFITQEDLGGAYTRSVADATLTNSPPVSLLMRGSGIFGFLAVVHALTLSDEQPSERQLYELAELGKPAGTATKCPRFLRLTTAPDTVRADGADFRDEILGAIYDPGDPRRKRTLVFAIEVSDTGERTIFQTLVGQEPWQRIGTLAFTEAAVSYNGDFVVHFHHPPWRTNRNDPASVARPELR